jgi:hypothetical protein
MIIRIYIEDSLCESLKDPETGRLRVRAIQDQSIPTNLVLKCSCAERKVRLIGTKFITENESFVKNQMGEYI